MAYNYFPQRPTGQKPPRLRSRRQTLQGSRGAGPVERTVMRQRNPGMRRGDPRMRTLPTVAPRSYPGADPRARTAMLSAGAMAERRANPVGGGMHRPLPQRPIMPRIRRPSISRSSVRTSRTPRGREYMR